MRSAVLIGLPALALACGPSPASTDVPRTPLSPVAAVDPERPLPTDRASAAVGSGIFGAHCTACHGEEGRGDGRLAPTLRPRPPDLTDRASLGGATPARYFDAISRGVIGSSMKRYDHVLDEAERWDAAFFAWGLAADPDDLAVGARRYASACARCHAPDGRGVSVGPFDAPERVGLSRHDVASRLVQIHPDHVDGLSERERRALVEHLFTFLYAPIPVPDPDPESAPAR